MPRPSIAAPWRALLATIALLAAPFANAGVLEEWASQWKAGTVWVDQPDYATVYAQTTDREIRFPHQVLEDDVIIALYEAQLTNKRSGKRIFERGVAVYYLVDGKPVAEEHAMLEGGEFDMATAGQLADVATTAAGLAAGFVEANPAMSGLASAGPAGILGMLALKVGISKFSETEPIESCISTKRMTSGMGWGAAAWNVGVLVGVPAIGILGAIAALTQTTDRPTAMRSCALAKIAESLEREITVASAN